MNNNFYLQGSYEEFLALSQKYMDSGLLREVTKTESGVLCDVVGRVYVYYSLLKNKQNEYWGLMMNPNVVNFVLNNESEKEFDAFGSLLHSVIEKKLVDASIFINNDTFFRNASQNRDSVKNVISPEFEAELIKKFEAINGRGA